MPLCGEKKWRPVDVTAADDDGDILHTIELTGERFGHVEDFKKRMAEYNEHKWTCQATGKHDLTFEEAYKSEEKAKQQIEHLFPPTMKKALLFFIHHSFMKEDYLVEGIRNILKKSYFEGEDVKMNLKQTVMGKVESICSEKEGSPTSDKENQKKYDVRTAGDGSSNNKLVRGVPHQYLERKTSLTDADISLFIALCATRTTSSSPWIISSDLKSAYNIKDKVHSLFASSPAGGGVKGNGTSKVGSEKKESKKKESQKTETDLRLLPSTSSDDSDDDDVPLVRKSLGVAPNGSKAKQQLKRLSKGSAKKKPPPPSLIDRTSSKSTKKEAKPAEVRRLSSAGKKTVTDYFKPASERRDSDHTASDSDDFVNLAAFKKAQSSSSLSPAQQAQKRFDSTIQRLEAHLAKHQVKLYNVAVSLAAKSFTSEQIATVKNEQIRKALAKCKADFDEQETLSKMTEAEKSDYLTEKAAKLKLEQRNRRIEAAKIANMKYEDTSLENLVPLPDLEAVAVPESVSASCFGDALMVTEFVHHFRDLLGDDDNWEVISAERLLTDMTLGERGYLRTTAKVLESLLHTLLQDNVAKDYETLCTKLNTLTTNTSTAAELARLALRRKDDDLADPAGDDDDQLSDGRRSRSQTPSVFHTNDIDETILVNLERSEFYELSASDQMTILRVLVGRLLDSYSINEFVESFHQRIESVEEEREKIRLEAEELRKRKAEIDAEIAASKEGELSGERRETTPPRGEGTSASPPPTPDMKTKLQKYREEKAQAAAEAIRRRKAEERQRRLQEVEAEIVDVRVKLEAANKRIADLELEKGFVKRVPTLGTDRVHRRYWFFRNGANPGLYVEDGWASKETQYSCFDPDSTSRRKNSIADFCGPIEGSDESAQPTFPQVEANRWYKIASMATFESLFEALHVKGERESGLKLRLQYSRGPICESFGLQEQKTEQKMDEDEESTEGFAASFKQTLEETARATRESGFGGVDDIDSWLERVESADTFPQLIDLLLECQQSIHDRFMRGRMKAHGGLASIKEAEVISSENGEIPTSKLLARWIELVKQCTTVSRLHVLLYVFDSYIDWDKSTKHQKCRTCRKKKDTENMLLCDDCNDGYHMYCLRPKLKRMPRGDWFCRSCKHKHDRKVRYTDEEDDDVVGSRHEEQHKTGRHTSNSTNRRRVYVSDDEEEELEEKEAAMPTRRSKRNMELRHVTISLDRVTDEPKRKRAKQDLEEEETDKPSEMEELCRQIFKRVSSSRTCTSVFSDLRSDGVASTRSSRKQPAIHSLSDIEKKLHSYSTSDQMFTDLDVLVARAKDLFANQPRKLAKIEEVQQELVEWATQKSH